MKSAQATTTASMASKNNGSRSGNAKFASAAATPGAMSKGRTSATQGGIAVPLCDHHALGRDRPSRHVPPVDGSAVMSFPRPRHHARMLIIPQLKRRAISVRG
jgi:hypothetical protein